MAVYGTQGDLLLNKDAKLYVPGQTKLAKGDIFLGGTGTGVTDEMLGKDVQRIYGNTAEDTAKAYSAYQSNPLTQLEGLKQAQLAQSIAGLNKQRDASLSNLAAEKATIEPEYQKQKIQAGVTAKQTARSFDEFMAQRGGNRSGIAGQGTLMNNIAYQGQRGALDQAEAGAITDNARRVTGVNNNYDSDVAAANAGIEAQYLQSYITQLNQDRAFNQSQNQFEYGKSRDAIGDSRYNDETQYNRSQAELEWDFRNQGYSDDQAYRMATLAISQQNANRVGSGGSSGTVKYSNSATLSEKEQIDEAIANGTPIDQLLSTLDGDMEDGTAGLKNYDPDYLRNYIEGKRNATPTTTRPSSAYLKFYRKYR